MKSLTRVFLTSRVTTASTTATISNDNWGNVASFTGESAVFTTADLNTFEMVQINASAGVITFTKRGIDNSSAGIEVAGNKKERGPGTRLYLTPLASNVFDLSSSGTQNFNNNINFSGVYNFSGSYNFSGANVVDSMKVNNNLRTPKFATTGERDTAIPNPQGDEICNVSGDIQHYNATTVQREVAGTSTPIPQASESVSGKAKVATTVEFNAGTDETGGVYNIPKISDVKGALNSISQFVDATYMAGEAITAGQCVFLESGPTSAEAATKQNISDVAGNTRVSFPFIGTGVAGTSFKVNICKTGSGHNANQNLNFRIETDNVGSPSGTLANANATATIAPASLTTSLADTTLTLTGSFTPTLGTKYHIVARQGSSLNYADTIVNGTNYYNIGYSTNDTSTRGLHIHNGAVYGNTVSTELIYLSSTLATDKLLSLTDADFTYKLLVDFPRIAKANYATGDIVGYDFAGISKALTGLTEGSVYYVSNTPGALSANAGTNICSVGVGVGKQGNILLGGRLGNGKMTNIATVSGYGLLEQTSTPFFISAPQCIQVDLSCGHSYPTAWKLKFQSSKDGINWIDIISYDLSTTSISDLNNMINSNGYTFYRSYVYMYNGHGEPYSGGATVTARYTKQN